MRDVNVDGVGTMQTKDGNVKKYEAQRKNTNHSSNSPIREIENACTTMQQMQKGKTKQNQKKEKKRSVLKNAKKSTINITSDDHQHKNHNPKCNNKVPIFSEKNQHCDTTKKEGNKTKTKK